MIYLAAFWSSATLITYNIAKYKSNPYLHKSGLAKEDWKKSQTKTGKKNCLRRLERSAKF